MSQTIGQRRALTQRRLVTGIGDLRHAANDANVEQARAAGMLVGAICWTVFVLFCAVAGIVAADWWSGGAAFVASVPAGAECVR